MTQPPRRPTTPDLTARLVDDGARFGSAPSGDFTDRVLASLPDARAGLPVDEARRDRRRRSALAAALLLVGLVGTWRALPDLAPFEAQRPLASAPGPSPGEWLAVPRSHETPLREVGGVPPVTATALPTPAVDGPPAGRGGALPWPVPSAPSTLAPLAAADQPYRRELAAVSAEAVAVAEGLAVRAARPLRALGQALLSRGVPR